MHACTLDLVSAEREATFTTLMEIQNYLRVSLSYGQLTADSSPLVVSIMVPGKWVKSSPGELAHALLFLGKPLV